MGASLRLSIALAIAMAATTAHSGQADDFPAVDSASYCRMIMDSNPASSLSPGLFDTCMDGENEAKEEALTRWRAAVPETRTQCQTIAKLGGHYSYEGILGCIRYIEQKI